MRRANLEATRSKVANDVPANLSDIGSISVQDFAEELCMRSEHSHRRGRALPVARWAQDEGATTHSAQLHSYANSLREQTFNANH
jgi:hypothetical protein